jgi:hypothetical protein
MKRIAAVAALLVTMLAVPAAAAMASTVGSGSDHPGQGQLVCPPPPFLFHQRPHVRHLNRYRLGRYRLSPYRNQRPRRNLVCSVTVPFQPQQSQNCPSGFAYGQAQSITFSVASGSSTVTEISGPTLAAGEEFSWDGNTYTIWSVNPGGGSFTMSQGATLYVNGGASTITGTGQLFCAS